MSISWLGPVKQISYTTDDLDRLIEFWENQVGLGPWNVFRGIALNMTYEGRAISIPVHVALAMHGGVLIELIQVNGDGPSPFHDALNRPIIGLQRLASVTDRIEADTEAALARGIEKFADGLDATGQRYVYFRSAAAPGVILELLENVPAFADFANRLEARARGYAQPAPAIVQSPAPSTPAVGKMRAALLHGYGSPDLFRIETIPEPVPGSGQIRVRVAGAAVNPVDIKSRQGGLAWLPLTFPARLGGDVAGVVDAVGPGVTDFQIGDRVMGMLNPTVDGAYAEKVVFYAAAFAHVPDGLDLIEAAALPIGVLTGTQLVEHGLGNVSGKKVLITGAGGSTGRAAVMAALDAGAIVTAGVRESSRDAVRDLPGVAVVDLSDDKALAAAAPFDCMADTIGEAAARLFAYVKPDGMVASVAVPPPVAPSGATQRFTNLVVAFDRDRLERFARELISKSRRMPIAHRLPLAEVAQAHRMMEQGGTGGKIVLIP